MFQVPPELRQLCLALCAITTTNAHAWGTDGHRLIAELAHSPRPPPRLTAKLMFEDSASPDSVVGQTDVQISMRDAQSNRHVQAHSCSFGTMDDIGGGSVDITFGVLAPPQWL